MEKTDTRFHHASGKDTPLLVDTRMATFLHKKMARAQSFIPVYGKTFHRSICSRWENIR